MLLVPWEKSLAIINTLIILFAVKQRTIYIYIYNIVRITPYFILLYSPFLMLLGIVNMFSLVNFN